MKLPIQSQPILRDLSTAKIIGSKGIIVQKLSVEEKCRRMCSPKRGAALAACIAFCVVMRSKKL
ncbi:MULTISPECIES: hypothetical protein [unclassified Microcoleus]|uniref:hypothetical protein n=1 Tax=unclassified Microcoleus TaxID=2642155 RepID=UPI002FD2610D